MDTDDVFLPAEWSLYFHFVQCLHLQGVICACHERRNLQELGTNDKVCTQLPGRHDPTYDTDA